MHHCAEINENIERVAKYGQRLRHLHRRRADLDAALAAADAESGLPSRQQQDQQHDLFDDAGGLGGCACWWWSGGAEAAWCTRVNEFSASPCPPPALQPLWPTAWPAV